MKFSLQKGATSDFDIHKRQLHQYGGYFLEIVRVKGCLEYFQKSSILVPQVVPKAAKVNLKRNLHFFLILVLVLHSCNVFLQTDSTRSRCNDGSSGQIWVFLRLVPPFRALQAVFSRCQFGQFMVEL